jgi:CHASE3 domain sensor protein
MAMLRKMNMSSRIGIFTFIGNLTLFISKLSKQSNRKVAQAVCMVVKHYKTETQTQELQNLTSTIVTTDNHTSSYLL